VKPDLTDSGFKGTGNYKFKVGFYYYNSNNELSSVNWSDDNKSKEVSITFVPTPTPNPTATPTSVPTSTPLPKPTSKPTATPKPSEMVKTQEKEVVLQPLSTNDPADSNLSVGKSSGSGNILETDDNLSILGEHDEATDNSDMKEASEDAKGTKPPSAGFLIICLIIVGCAMLGVSVFLSFREAKRVK